MVIAGAAAWEVELAAAGAAEVATAEVDMELDAAAEEVGEAIAAVRDEKTRAGSPEVPHWMLLQAI